MNQNRIILHVDVNNAFLSWTAARLLKEGFNLDIRNIPCIIARTTNNRSGIVLAKSMPAKNLGIKTAMPIFKAFNIYGDLKVFPPEYEYYQKISNQIHKLLFEFSDLVEKASIDEWYLDITKQCNLNSAFDYAKQIQNTIFEKFNITVNIGIANCKALAKTCSDFEKPNKIHTMYNYEIKEKLWPLSVSKLFLVGKKTNEKLNSLGIKTIGQFASKDPKFIQKRFGKLGITLLDFANGRDFSKVDPCIKPPQSISHAITFENPINTKNEAYANIMIIAEEVTKRLRKHNFFTQVVSIKIKYFNFTEKSKQSQISPTKSTNDIYALSKQLFDEIYDISMPIRMISIKLDKLDTKIEVQTSLFDILENLENKDNQSKKIKKRFKPKNNIDKIIDEINKEFGEHTLFHATSMLKEE